MKAQNLKCSILAVLSQDLLAQILYRLPEPSDRKACRLVCRAFFYAELGHRKTLKVLRLESLDALVKRYGFIERLDLSACAGLDDRTIAAALGGGEAAGLRVLNLRRCSGVSWMGLAAVVEGCRKLESLDLSHCFRIGDREAAAVAAPGLRELSLEKCLGVTDVGLAKVALGCPRLERLRVKWCLDISDVGIELLARKCHGLKELDISYLKVTNTSLLSISSLEKLEHLSMIACYYLDDEGLGYLNNGNNSLQIVDVSRCHHMTSSGLASLVEGNKSLRKLIAGDCFLELSSHFLFKLSSVKTTLRCLKLDGSQVSSSNLQTIGSNCKNLIEIGFSKCMGVTNEAISELVSGCISLRSLDLTCCRDLDDTALQAISSSCKKLVSLLLESCTLVTENGIGSIASSCTDLQEIDLTDCSICDMALKHLSKCSELRLLKLGFCSNISDKGIAHVGYKCRNLQELDLYRCAPLGDTGIAALATGCKRLRKLNLCYCARITDTGLKSLSYLKEISDLELRGLVHITSIGITAIAMGCISLTHLDMKRCYSISDDGFLALAQYAENLRQVNISYCQMSEWCLRRFLCSLRCLQDVKMVHLTHVSIVGYELALWSCCGRVKKLKLLISLQRSLSLPLLHILQSRSCRIRWVDKPLLDASDLLDRKI